MENTALDILQLRTDDSLSRNVTNVRSSMLMEDVLQMTGHAIPVVRKDTYHGPLSAKARNLGIARPVGLKISILPIAVTAKRNKE